VRGTTGPEKVIWAKVHVSLNNYDQEGAEKLFSRLPKAGFSKGKGMNENNRMLKKAVQQGPRERSPRNVLLYVRRLSD